MPDGPARPAAVTFLPQGSVETEQACGATAGGSWSVMPCTWAGMVDAQKGWWQVECVNLTHGHLGSKKYQLLPGLSMRAWPRSCLPRHTQKCLGFLGFFFLGRKRIYRPLWGRLRTKLSAL